MHTVDCVLFDMNDVLCRYDKARRIAALAQICGKPPRDVEAAIWTSGFEDSGDAGDLDADAYLAGFGERLGCALSLAQWTQTLHDALTPMPDTLALVSRLAHQCHVALLTNNNLLVLREAPRVVPEISALFGDRFHVSAEYKARKPDALAYRRCLDALGFAPTQTLFIDDSAVNAEGARAAGLHAHRFTDAPALAGELHALGCLPRM